MTETVLLFLRLFYEFFKTGLFAVGGGMATLPFLYDMGAKYPEWFCVADKSLEPSDVIANMIAVSESLLTTTDSPAAAMSPVDAGRRP